MMLEDDAQLLRTAGWYKDADDPTGHRYWNGVVWLPANEVASWGEPTTRPDID